jgi:hypothetical protein
LIVKGDLGESYAGPPVTHAVDHMAVARDRRKVFR